MGRQQRRVLATFTAISLAASVLLAPAPVEAGTAGHYSAPAWFPLRGTTVVGCTWSNGCASGYHGYAALDIARDRSGSAAGDPVYASGAGLATIYSNGSTCGGPGTAAKVVQVDHGNGVKSYYYHLGSFAITGSTWVDENDVIGYAGHTGYVDPCTFNHLHFEVRNNGAKVSPGQLKACHGGQLVTYPAAFAGNPGDWDRVGLWSEVRHDGTSCGSSQPPPADPDGDGLTGGQDLCPLVWGPVANRGCPFDDHSLAGDFTGDGLTDVLTFYNYGTDNLGAWLFPGTGSGIGREQFLWATGNGMWNWNSSKFVAGQFTNDSYLDVVAFYNYGNDNLGAWLFPGTGNGVGREQFLWSTGNGMWNWNQSRFLPGDFTGDGKTDVIALYDHGNDNLGVWLFPGTGNGVAREQFQWATGNGMWNQQSSKYLAGEFTGDGRPDIAAFYNYGNDNLGLWLLPGSGTGVGREQFQWSTGNGMWNWNNSTFHASDVNSDGRTDVLAFYNHGTDNLGLWLFPGAGAGLGREQFQWSTGNGMWNWNSSRMFAGRFGSESAADVVGLYNYGNDNLGAWLFPGNGTSVGREQFLWSTGNGMWNWNSM